jgi:Ca-activated chloride channel family protein
MTSPNDDRDRSHEAHGPAGTGTPEVGLDARPEKRLVRPGGSRRHVDFLIRVPKLAPQPADRRPLNLALVLDRSGSMTGEPIVTARRAALAVIDRLEERDRVAVVAFDDRIDVLQPAAQATGALKERVRPLIDGLEARASTALHQGWLTGCQAIAADSQRDPQGALSRCFLLTDGLANVGLTDPEQIATEVASVREQAGISTSTFGIGPGYDEFLLGPMAVAGGGQFHHLRTPDEIATTFVGELGSLLTVALPGARLEIDLPAHVKFTVVSQYWASMSPDGRTLSIALGDLLSGDERHVIVAFGFSSGGVDPRDRWPFRVRLVWTTGDALAATDWQEIEFQRAADDACTREERDAEAMHWIVQHQADLAMREATQKSRSGDLAGARAVLMSARQRMSPYAAHDSATQAVAEEVVSLEQSLASAPLASMPSKEFYSRAQRRSRGQKDLRS